MNIGRQVLINYAVSALFASLYEWILPQKGKELFRSVAATVIIAVTVLPLFQYDYSGLNAEIAGLYEDKSEVGQSDASLLVGEVKRKIYKQVEEMLISIGVTEYEIYVTADYSETENAVNIEKVKVIIGNEFENKKSETESQLTSMYGNIGSAEVKNE